MHIVKQSSKSISRHSSRIQHNRPCLDSIDAQAAYDVVMSGWVAGGNVSKLLEEALARRIVGKTGEAAVCVNGTSALFLALHSLGIGVGDEVIIPTYVCTADLNAVKMIGATPVLADIKNSNLSFSRSSIEPHLTDRTRAIIVVHTYGIPCEIEVIRSLNLPIIEDCAQSLGSMFADGSPVGSKGDLAVFSFYATKYLTGGCGGGVLSSNPERIASIRDYLDFDAPVSYFPRFNFQLSDINAAVCLSQFQKLDSFLQRRLELGRDFVSAVSNPERASYSAAKDGPNLFRFLLNFETPGELQACKQHLFDKSIDTIVPLESRELLHRYLKQDQNCFPNAELAAKTLLSLPIYPCLGIAEQDRIVTALKEFDFN